MKLFPRLTTLIILTVFMLCIPGTALAKTRSITTGAVPVKIQVEHETQVDFVGDYIIIREKINQFKAKFTIKNKRDYKTVRTYFIGFSRPFHLNPLSGNRYIAISLEGTGQCMEHYWLDLVTGETKKLPDTSPDFQIEPFSTGLGALIRDGSRYSIVNVRLGQVLGDIKPYKWNKESSYIVYYKAGLIQLLDIATMRPTVIPGIGASDLLAVYHPQYLGHPIVLENRELIEVHLSMAQ